MQAFDIKNDCDDSCTVSVRPRGKQFCCPTSDGRLLYVADYYDHQIRCIDLQRRTVHPIIGNGGCFWAAGSQFANPFHICFDRLTIIPESALFVRDWSTIYRLQLRQSVSDVIRYHIEPWCNHVIWHSLIRDLWHIIASYLTESQNITMFGPIRVLAMETLPSGDILAANSLTLYTLNSETDSIEMIVNGPILGLIYDIAIDERSRCVYVTEHSSIRKVTLPSKYFRPATPKR